MKWFINFIEYLISFFDTNQSNIIEEYKLYPENLKNAYATYTFHSKTVRVNGTEYRELVHLFGVAYYIDNVCVDKLGWKAKKAAEYVMSMVK